jgi:methylmalonyl-CoA/ethylmalonyl-CoA epimerase
MTKPLETPFRLSPIYQLGYVVANVENTCRHYESAFGIGPFTSPIEVPMNNADFMGRIVNTKIQAAFAKSGDVQIELIQPLDGDNPYTEFLARRGDGIHHLGFKVADMEVAKAEFAMNGFEPFFSCDLVVMKFAYYDMSELGGLALELLWGKTEI